MTRLTDPPTKASPSPVARLRPDPEAWRIALELARGDAGLLEVLDGGRIVLVRNR